VVRFSTAGRVRTAGQQKSPLSGACGDCLRFARSSIASTSLQASNDRIGRLFFTRFVMHEQSTNTHIRRCFAIHIQHPKEKNR